MQMMQVCERGVNQMKLHGMVGRPIVRWISRVQEYMRDMEGVVLISQSKSV